MLRDGSIRHLVRLPLSPPLRAVLLLPGLMKAPISTSQESCHELCCAKPEGSAGDGEVDFSSFGKQGGRGSFGGDCWGDK